MTSDCCEVTSKAGKSYFVCQQNSIFSWIGQFCSAMTIKKIKKNNAKIHLNCFDSGENKRYKINGMHELVLPIALFSLTHEKEKNNRNASSKKVSYKFIKWIKRCLIIILFIWLICSTQLITYNSLCAHNISCISF